MDYIQLFTVSVCGGGGKRCIPSKFTVEEQTISYSQVNFLIDLTLTNFHQVRHTHEVKRKFPKPKLRTHHVN